MESKQIIDYLRRQSNPRERTPEVLQEWHSHTDALHFFLNSTTGDVPLVILSKNLFLYAIAVPQSTIHGDYVEDIKRWNFTLPSGYGYGYGYDKDDVQEFIYQPLEGHTNSKILDSGNAFFFHRYFSGREGRKGYLELNQQISHLLDLHWVEEKGAWCDMDDQGIIVPQAKYIIDDDISLCTLRQEKLDLYLFLTKMCLVRCIDVARSTDWSMFSDNLKDVQNIADTKNQLFATAKAQIGHDGSIQSSFLRGFQIIKNEQSRQKMVAILTGDASRKYESFIIWDWKNRRICECSSSPDQFGNYFIKSDLPFGTSPAFFKPEVLLQYKQDPVRYSIDERLISCRGGWELRYDVNDEGQIHAYLCDLSNLPYEEQLHWKAFNDPPRAGLSKRAIKTDFLAEWDMAYSPLQSLKEILQDFPQTDDSGRQSKIWAMPSMPDTRDISFLNYIVTDSPKEWEDQILVLGQILGEGFARKQINKIAESFGCRDEKLGSIKQLGLILQKLGISDWEKITCPIVDAWDLRSKAVAHPGSARPKVDLKAHYKELLTRCDESMHELANLVKRGFFNQ